MSRWLKASTSSGPKPARTRAPARPPAVPLAGPALDHLRAWLGRRGWRPFAFQEETWRAFAAGQSGLVSVPTGAGKTYAAYLGALAEVLDQGAGGLQILYVTPLRALTRDLEAALRAPVDELLLPVTVASRTGDTSSAARARLSRRPPEILLTTPESLSLMLSHPEAPDMFRQLRAVIVDEWHELLGSKRGTQVELALARLRGLAPALRTWALSATLADPAGGAQVAVGVGREATVVRGAAGRPVEITTLLPEAGALPWAGHLGLSLVDEVARRLEGVGSALVFCNTRSSAERWYQALLEARPSWEGELALHHGSLDRGERERVEAGLKEGALRVVVATSSLDLGVDFAPVERVLQIGSPKSVARTVQRAGRASHRPGAACSLTLVPTHAFELIELLAVREAAEAGRLEPRNPRSQPLDVLVQHLVTCALGGGFEADALFDEVRGAAAYASLPREEFDWALDLVCHGGRALGAYPEYRKVTRLEGRHVVQDDHVARRHRASIGTIVADGMIEVRFARGGRLGQVEESFVARLRPGDRFTFAGRSLAFVRLQDMVAHVRLAPGPARQLPSWRGGRLPMSPVLAPAVREALERAGRGESAPELQAARPLVEAQARLSRVPTARQTLAETCATREGHWLFLYPFEGRMVHEGLAALLAYRLARSGPVTFALVASDHGLALSCPEPFPYAERLTPELFSDDQLAEDTRAAINLGELAKRQFREVARVAGLVFQGMPRANKSARQVQASAGILYEVFRRHDPDNRLLAQAEREVLADQIDLDRLAATLARLREHPPVLSAVEHPTPLGFPLLVERLAATLSTESLLARVERMKARWQTSR